MMRESDENTADVFSDGVAQAGTAQFAVVRDPQGTTVRVSGELDIATAPQLQQVLAQIPVEGRLLIDLDAVEFMDSSGLAAIIHAQEAARLNGHRLTVRYSNPQVKHLFELTGMHNHVSLE